MAINKAPVYRQRRRNLAVGALSVVGASFALTRCADMLDGPECSKETVPITIDSETNTVWEATDAIDGIEHVDRQGVVSIVLERNPHVTDLGNIAPGTVIVVPVSCDN